MIRSAFLQMPDGRLQVVPLIGQPGQVIVGHGDDGRLPALLDDAVRNALLPQEGAQRSQVRIQGFPAQLELGHVSRRARRSSAACRGSWRGP